MVGEKGRCGDLIDSVLDSRSSGPGSSPVRGHWVVFLGKTLHSQISPLHPRVLMGTGEYNVGGNSTMD